MDEGLLKRIVDQGILEGLVFHDYNVVEENRNNHFPPKRVRYTPFTRPLGAGDISEVKEERDEFVIVTKDGKKYRIQKERG